MTASIERIFSAILAMTLSALSMPAFAYHAASCRKIDDHRAVELRDRNAVVTDIDGVLTEYINLDFASTNGAFLDKGTAFARTDAALMMSIYARRGYLVIYMVGRPRTQHGDHGQIRLRRLSGLARCQRFSY